MSMQPARRHASPCRTRSDKAISSGSPARPASTSTAYRSTASTNGAIEIGAHGLSRRLLIWNDHKAYVMIRIAAETLHTKRRYVAV